MNVAQKSSSMEWYLGRNYTMPAYCYILLTDTVIIPTGIVVMHAYNSILFVDNDIMFDGGNNLKAVKACIIISFVIFVFSRKWTEISGIWRD